jgi:acetoin utilization deacetylase AcuC-like enzyme
MGSTTGLILDECFARHVTGPEHAERPERIPAIQRALTSAQLVEQCALIAPTPIDLSLVLANHSQAYIDRLREHCASGKNQIDCADSVICPDSFEIARLATGAVIRAVDAVATGDLDNAFCVIRPPGHHAERDCSMGFCLFNNVAIAARHLLKTHGVERVLILDWDVHHGNGTQHSFEDDPRVFFCSLHGHPDTLYPGTGYAHERGKGAGEGTTLNLPMQPGAGDAEYRAAFAEHVLPAARVYKPEFILISAGFDAHRADPLAQINLETSSFKWMTEELRALAEECCGGQLVSMLEGGYNLNALGESAAAHLRCLMGN